MKPKNVMLLGFVNKAVDYLDRHMDEEPDARLAELKNVDLVAIKNKLSKNLDSTLGVMESTMSTLLKAGNEAFDEFIEENHGKDNIEDEFNRIFDVDFDEERKANQEELVKLLSFYNLDDDFGTVPVSNEDYDLMNQIIKNSTSDDVDDIMPIEHDSAKEDEIDSIFTEIVNNEDKTIKEDANEIVEENVNIEDIQEVESENIEEVVEEQIPVEETIEEQSEVVEIETIEELPVDEQTETTEDVTKEDGVQVEDTEEIDDSVETQHQSYVSTLIDELREQLLREEAEKKEREDRNKEIYNHISELYKYLPDGFIRSVYEYKESIANDYPVGKEVIVLHRVKFTNVEDLRKFVEICLQHKYTINADESKLIVDSLKQFVNTDGKIISNIYEVANQGYLLHGTYEGYNVIVEE